MRLVTLGNGCWIHLLIWHLFLDDWLELFTPYGKLINISVTSCRPVVYSLSLRCGLYSTGRCGRHFSRMNNERRRRRRSTLYHRAWEKIYVSFHSQKWVIDDLVDYQVGSSCVHCCRRRGDTLRMDWFRWIHHGHVGKKKYTGRAHRHTSATSYSAGRISRTRAGNQTLGRESISL